MLWYSTDMTKKKTVEIRGVEDLGALVRRVRKSQRATQVEVSQFSNLGSRFVVDFEAGKPTLQIGKALDVLQTLGIRLYAETYEEGEGVNA